MIPPQRRLRIFLTWATVAAIMGAPVLIAAASPYLAYRNAAYITGGFAGIIALALLVIQPLLAAVDGTVTHFVENHPTAGWGLVITDSDGWEYRYYHVNNDTPGTDDGLDDGSWRFPAVSS